MFIEKNTYDCLEKNKEAIIEDLHSYLKNIYFMKALSQALGPEFPGNTSKERIQLLNIFYLNCFNALAQSPEKLPDIKKALSKLMDTMLKDYRTNPDIFKQILFLCGMFGEHFKINLAGIPTNMLQYINSNLDSYAKGISEWNED